MNITRRSFLKAVGFAAAGAIIVPDFEILLPFENVVMPELFKLRKLCAYDIKNAEMLVRYDVMYRIKGRDLQQYHVSATIPENIERYEYVKRIHNPMTLVLKNQLQHDRVTYKDLIPMNTPASYREPEWFTKLIGG